MSLTEEQAERYSRQLVLPEWSGEAQERLRAASVLVVGLGALGSPVAQYLAAAGVGRLALVDDESVELSNLGRQVLHYTPDVGVPKVESASSKLHFLNPDVLIERYPARLEEMNAAALAMGNDLVVDCSDSFATRYAVNDACCAERIALVEGGALGLGGLVMSIRPGETACYRCAFPAPPADGASCADAGLLGPVAGVVGSLMALEALKLLGGVGEPLLDRLLEVDGATGTFTRVRTARRPDCPACGSSV